MSAISTLQSRVKEVDGEEDEVVKAALKVLLEVHRKKIRTLWMDLEELNFKFMKEVD